MKIILNTNERTVLRISESDDHFLARNQKMGDEMLTIAYAAVLFCREYHQTETMQKEGAKLMHRIILSMLSVSPNKISSDLSEKE